jgi:hypothetical protein
MHIKRVDLNFGRATGGVSLQFLQTIYSVCDNGSIVRTGIDPAHRHAYDAKHYTGMTRGNEDEC